jgi:hypothetical protein
VNKVTWFFLVCVLTLLAPHAHARPLISGEGGLSASLPDNASCTQNMQIVVRAPSEKSFSGDRVELQRLLAGSRAALSIECPETTSANIIGQVNGKTVFRGNISSQDEWQLNDGETQASTAIIASPISRTEHSTPPQQYTPITNEFPPSATCHYDPRNPLVGCWLVIDPQKYNRVLTNITPTGWFQGKISDMAAGTPPQTGARIKKMHMVGTGPYLEFNMEGGFNHSYSGPYFSKSCSVMELHPYAPTNAMMVMMGANSDVSLLMVRVNQKYLTADMLDRQGPVQHVDMLLPNKEAPFTNCVDNAEDRLTDDSLFNLMMVAIPSLRFAESRALGLRLLPKRLTRSKGAITGEPVAAGEAGATQVAKKGGAARASSAANASRLSNQLTAQEIANGHAFEKHVIKKGEFPGIKTRQEFQEHIEDVLDSPSDIRYYKDGRVAYLQESSGTVVIRNPGFGESTAFRPDNWNKYISDILPSRSTPYP